MKAPFQPDPGPRLEFEDHPRRCCLDGRDVRVGDRLELWTASGWVGGEFEWDSSGRLWARLVVAAGERGEDALVIVLRPGLRCRWPEGS